MGVAHATLRVDEVLRWPIIIVEGASDHIFEFDVECVILRVFNNNYWSEQYFIDA